MTAILLGGVAAICWAVHDVAVRHISQSVTVLASMMTVLIFGAIFQFFVLLGFGGIEPLPIHTTLYAILSGICFFVAAISLFAAFQRGPVRLVAPIIASYPVLSVAIAMWRGKEVTPGQWLAVAAIGLGVAVVSARASEEDSSFPRFGPTIVLSLLATVGFAMTFALGQFASEQASEGSVSLVARLAAVLVLALVTLLLRASVWPGLRALPILCFIGALDAIALRSVIAAGGLPDAQYASVVASMFGLLSIILAWLILKEKMNALQWLGCLMAFTGVGFLTL